MTAWPSGRLRVARTVNSGAADSAVSRVLEIFGDGGRSADRPLLGRQGQRLLPGQFPCQRLPAHPAQYISAAYTPPVNSSEYQRYARLVNALRD